MSRRADRKQINFTVSAAQHAAYLAQAAQRGMTPGDYLRFVLAQDAAARGMDWPDDLPGIGKEKRKK